MLKLYKFEGSRVLYWEAWEHDGEVVLHWGETGEPGESQTIPLKHKQSSKKLIATEATKYRTEGYRELRDGEEHTVLVQYKIDGWGTPEDLDKRHAIEEMLNEVLGWTGNGLCDGGDIGSGTMNVCCLVIDPYLASQAIVEELSDHNLLEGALIALELEESFEVLYPENHNTPFAYWYE